MSASASAAAISLFSGCGGDTCGLERAGFKVVAFNEFKGAPVKSHLANFPESVALLEPKKDVGDITKLADSVFEPYAGKVDIVFAGFPCQGFSTAGKKQTNDPRNQMYHQFVRVARITKPSFIIGENVTGLLTMKSGPKEEDPLVIDLIRKAFEEIGYTITYQVLEADDFGVPQKRKRLLIIGWRGDKVPTFDVASFWTTVKSWGAEQPTVTLRSFVQPTLEGALKLQPQCIPHNFASVAVSIAQDAEPTGQPHPYVALKANATDESYGGKNFDRLLSCGKRDSPIHSEVLDLDKPCKTIICTYDHQPRLLVGLRKPDGSCYVRALLPDELKQVQGFPANFVLCGNEKEKIVQVGNAVPPALIHGIALALRSYLAPKQSQPVQQSAPAAVSVVAAAQPPKKRRVVVVKKAAE
jgi:DNA (cytosine-5)-methyltransferase 1